MNETDEVAPLGWEKTRPIVEMLTFDFYDGTLNGILLLESPREEWAFDALIVGDCGDLYGVRIAQAWEVPEGTLAKIRGDAPSKFLNSFFACERDRWIEYYDRTGNKRHDLPLSGPFDGDCRLGRPDVPRTLIAMGGDGRLLGSWRVNALPDKAAMLRLLQEIGRAS
jgi:hypothetical protein